MLIATPSARKANILKYIESVTSNVDSATKDTMLNAPLPMVIFHPETGGIVWCNEGFQEISGRSEQLFDSRIGDVVPGSAPGGCWNVATRRRN